VTTTFRKLREKNLARVDVFHPLDSWSPTDWATAVAGEFGAACGLIKRLRRGENVCLETLAYELADTVIYLDLLAARLGIDLERAVEEKFDIVSHRVGSRVFLKPSRRR
jgi:NTP pyrophosphatase (non-canonical NTP hydrolase)